MKSFKYVCIYEDLKTGILGWEIKAQKDSTESITISFRQVIRRKKLEKHVRGLKVGKGRSIQKRKDVGENITKDVLKSHKKSYCLLLTQNCV